MKVTFKEDCPDEILSKRTKLMLDFVYCVEGQMKMFKHLKTQHFIFSLEFSKFLKCNEKYESEKKIQNENKNEISINKELNDFDLMTLNLHFFFFFGLFFCCAPVLFLFFCFLKCVY